MPEIIAQCAIAGIVQQGSGRPHPLHLAIGDEGHEIGIHSWIHEANTKLPPGVERELTMRSADTLERIFGIFSQGEGAAQRAEGGLGIGLALVRGLVELHGGRVEATSEGVGRGTTVTVTLPLAVRGDATGAGDAREAATPASGIRS